MLKSEYTAILFAIYTHRNYVGFEWLLEYLQDEELSPNEIRQYINEMIAQQLIEITFKEDKIYLSLTASGEETVDLAAEIISSSLLNYWQQGMI